MPPFQVSIVASLTYRVPATSRANEDVDANVCVTSVSDSVPPVNVHGPPAPATKTLLAVPGRVMVPEPVRNSPRSGLIGPPVGVQFVPRSHVPEFVSQVYWLPGMLHRS